MLKSLMERINNLEYTESNTVIDENSINELGFILIRNDLALSINGMAIAGMFAPKFESMEEKTPMIIVDDDFYNLSEESRSVIIAHELGHWLYHQHRAEENKEAGEYIRHIEDEFEADNYAVEQMGVEATIQGLKDLMEELDYNEDAVEELRLRIEALMNKFTVTC
jgi:Zn-dependent protease with chaperone function